MFDFRKVLLVNAHADDIELGCGGTIVKMLEKGIEVHSLVLSLRKKTVPDDFPEKLLIDEVKKAARELSLNEENLHILNFPNRIFPAIRQEILDAIVDYNRKIMPELVFCPSFDDMHQDHLVTANEVFRAFKNQSIFSYELPWNRIRTVINLYSTIENRHLEKKIKALSHYKSQSRQRLYFNEFYIKSLAHTRGVQIKQEYAEAFEIVRLIDCT
jgi:LmbE family N-acetylglucosaminyl deacetylase